MHNTAFHSFSQRFPRFLNNPIAPAGSLQEVPPVLRKMVRDTQMTLVLQRFPSVPGHLCGIMFFAQHVVPSAGSRKACFTNAFSMFLRACYVQMTPFCESPGSSETSIFYWFYKGFRHGKSSLRFIYKRNAF